MKFRGELQAPEDLRTLQTLTLRSYLDPSDDFGPCEPKENDPPRMAQGPL